MHRAQPLALLEIRAALLRQPLLAFSAIKEQQVRFIKHPRVRLE